MRRRTDRLSSLFGVVVLGVSCGQPAFEDGGSIPDGGGADAACLPNLTYLEAEFATRGPYAAPRPEVPFERPEGSVITREILLLPWDRASYSQAWLHEGDALSIRYRWMTGTGLPAESTVLFQVFVNGQAVEIEPGTWRQSVAISLGLGELELSLPSSTFPPGLSTLHVYDRYDYGRLTFSEAPSIFPITIFNMSTELESTHEDTSGYTSQGADPRFSTRVRNRDTDTGFLRVTYPPTDGVYRLRITVQAPHNGLQDCPSATDTVAIVAALDGEPVDLTPFGRAIYATLTASEARVFDVEVSGLPTDGMTHRLELLELAGIGHPTEDTFGAPTMWSGIGRPVGSAQWE